MCEYVCRCIACPLVRTREQERSGARLHSDSRTTSHQLISHGFESPGRRACPAIEPPRSVLRLDEGGRIDPFYSLERYRVCIALVVRVIVKFTVEFTVCKSLWRRQKANLNVIFHFDSRGCYHTLTFTHTRGAAVIDRHHSSFDSFVVHCVQS